VFKKLKFTDTTWHSTVWVRIEIWTDTIIHAMNFSYHQLHGNVLSSENIDFGQHCIWQTYTRKTCCLPDTVSFVVDVALFDELRMYLNSHRLTSFCSGWPSSFLFNLKNHIQHHSSLLSSFSAKHGKQVSASIRFSLFKQNEEVTQFMLFRR
jgi:hypothetical protein